jgi:hypothetical protein
VLVTRSPSTAIKSIIAAPQRRHAVGGAARLYDWLGVPANGTHSLTLRGRSRITEHGGAGGGFHPAIVRTDVRAFALSVIPGKRRRISIAAESSPSWLKMARIASASASVTKNILKGWQPARTTGKPGSVRYELN